jgi:hypothetical protein
VDRERSDELDCGRPPPWDRFLDAYVDPDHPSGVNRVRYGNVIPRDRRLLDGCVSSLQAVTVSRLNRSEQEAYWINLYNALTLKVVLDPYPVKSIRDIDLSGSGPGGGPWQAKLLTVEGARFDARPAKGTLVLSSIYDWFIEDFGGTRERLFSHLLRYLPPEGKARLERFGGAIRYEYDWALNE